MADPAAASIVNAAVYLGGGEMIERGFVSWRGETVTGVGAMADYGGAPGAVEHDMAGCLVLPGLVDCHIHLIGYARSLMRIDLSRTASLEEGLARVAESVSRLPEGEWLRGRGWDRQRWGMDGFPDRGMLDRVAPRNPVGLWSRDGHLIWANSAAIEISGAGDPGATVEGGEIDRDDRGRPTGIFKERAALLIAAHMGGEDVEATCRAVAEACSRLRSYGLTGVHTSESEASYEMLAAARGRGIVGLDVFTMVETADPGRVAAIAALPGVGCVKVLADGTLGSQTASMLEPYCGGGDLGVEAVSRERLAAIAREAAGRGLALAVHAIGDRACRVVLDVFEETRPLGRSKGQVLRLEHAQLLHPDDIPRLGRLGVIASMQPIHLVSDMAVAERYWGERCRWAYAWASMRRGGAVLAFGSDAPIEEPDPLKGIHAAVTRRDPGRPGSAPWYPQECIDVAEAVDAYTLGAARASGRAGVLKAGLRADLTILDRNILRARDADAILEARVVGTVAAGHALLS